MTEMDEIARLRSALKTAPAPAPDPQAMARALAAARAEFAATSQETAPQPRQTRSKAPSFRRRLATLIGSADMLHSFPSLRPYYYGGASLAAVTLAVLSTGLHQRGLEGFLPPPPPAKTAQASQGAEIRSPAPALSDADQSGISLAESGPRPRRVVQQDTQALIAPAVRSETQRSLARQSEVRTQALLSKPALGAAACSTLAAGCEQGPPPRVAVGEFETRYAVDAEPAIAPPPPEARDRFEAPRQNPVKVTAEDPVSTFSVDVDTASYAFVRRALMAGRLPPKQAVRVEEMVNYFAYDYAPPEGAHPFAVHPVVMPTPWNPETRLLRIALQGAQITGPKPRSNLVFLIDISGSMQSADKLPLLINSLRMLLDRLAPEDTVGIVTYAGQAGVALEPTPVAEAGKIRRVLNSLMAGGSTAGAAGIEEAYALAEAAYIEDGVNRVILATDGDFNVGLTDREQLTGYVERKRDSGVMLSVLGFGQGNYNDALMQRLAQNGNGQAAYIDTLAEARKVLVEEASAALYPIAKDVKIQIEFNPAEIAEYRLIGYETRALAREDFNNDRVDAGEIGAGHRVTALYEITPVAAAGRRVDALRYGKKAPGAAREGELAFLKLRYKQPGADSSRLIERPITRADAQAATGEAQFAAAVAGFAELLRGGRYMEDYDFADVLAAAEAAKGPDRWGYRAEFLTLVRLADSAIP
ncbi:MAG: von Willebrand factor type A domain-containing protein [Pseudomonadota bacterium]